MQYTSLVQVAVTITDIPPQELDYRGSHQMINAGIEVDTRPLSIDGRELHARAIRFGPVIRDPKVSDIIDYFASKV